MLDHRKSSPDDYYNSARETSIYYSYEQITEYKAGMERLYMFMKTKGSLGFQTFEGQGFVIPKTFLCMRGGSTSCFLFCCFLFTKLVDNLVFKKIHRLVIGGKR